MPLSAIYRRRALLTGATVLALAVPLGVTNLSAANESSQEVSPAALTIVGTDRDVDGKKVFLREGVYKAAKGAGFGWTKIQRKHNITNKDVIGFTIKEPGGRQKVGVSKFRYDAIANRAVCGAISCQIVYTRPLIAINDVRKRPKPYYGVQMNGRRPGIITTYCFQNGAWKCPDWVNTAANARPGARSDDAEEATDLTVLSYEPVTEGQLKQLSEGGRVDGAKVL